MFFPYPGIPALEACSHPHSMMNLVYPAFFETRIADPLCSRHEVII